MKASSSCLRRLQGQFSGWPFHFAISLDDDFMICMHICTWGSCRKKDCTLCYLHNSLNGTRSLVQLLGQSFGVIFIERVFSKCGILIFKEKCFPFDLGSFQFLHGKNYNHLKSGFWTEYLQYQYQLHFHSQNYYQITCVKPHLNGSEVVTVLSKVLI